MKHQSLFNLLRASYELFVLHKNYLKHQWLTPRRRLSHLLIWRIRSTKFGKTNEIFNFSNNVSSMNAGLSTFLGKLELQNTKKNHHITTYDWSSEIKIIVFLKSETVEEMYITRFSKPDHRATDVEHKYEEHKMEFSSSASETKILAGNLVGKLGWSWHLQ